MVNLINNAIKNPKDSLLFHLAKIAYQCGIVEPLKLDGYFVEYKKNIIHDDERYCQYAGDVFFRNGYYDAVLYHEYNETYNVYPVPDVMKVALKVSEMSHCNFIISVNDSTYTDVSVLYTKNDGSKHKVTRPRINDALAEYCIDILSPFYFN